MSELGRGAGYLGRGLGFLWARPRLLLLGMAPAFVVLVALSAGWIVLVLHVGDLTAWATPFADDWVTVVREVLRVLLALALLVGALLLASALFVGLTLTIGEPCYERIRRAVEDSLGGVVPDGDVGLWRSARDGLRLVLVGLGFSLLVLLSGFVPVIGPTVGIVLGVVLSGRLLGRELLGRPLGARGLDAAAQRAALAPRARVVLGFGVTTQLCFLVPLGGVLVMPAAVAGATFLARAELDLDT